MFILKFFQSRDLKILKTLLADCRYIDSTLSVQDDARPYLVGISSAPGSEKTDRTRHLIPRVDKHHSICSPTPGSSLTKKQRSTSDMSYNSPSSPKVCPTPPKIETFLIGIQFSIKPGRSLNTICMQIIMVPRLHPPPSSLLSLKTLN